MVRRPRTLAFAVVATFVAGVAVVLAAPGSLWAFAILAAGGWALFARALLLSSAPRRPRVKSGGKR